MAVVGCIKPANLGEDADEMAVAMPVVPSGLLPESFEMNVSQIFSQADQESALQRRLYRFYIRRLENLTEAKIQEQLKEIRLSRKLV